MSALCPRLLLGVWAVDRGAVFAQWRGCLPGALSRSQEPCDREQPTTTLPDPPPLHVVATASPLDVGSESEWWLPTAHPGVVPRAEPSGGVLARTPSACAYASGADRPPPRFFGVAFELSSSCLARHARWLKKMEHQRACCKPMAQRDVGLGGASRGTANGAS